MHVETECTFNSSPNSSLMGARSVFASVMNYVSLFKLEYCETGSCKLSEMATDLIYWFICFICTKLSETVISLCHWSVKKMKYEL